MSTIFDELEYIDRMEREREEREKRERYVDANDVRWIRATLNEATNYLRIITTIMVIGLILIFYLGYKLGF